MMEPLRANISANLFSLKAEMGGLAELVDNWVLTLQGEEERRNRVLAIRDTLIMWEETLPQTGRRELFQHINALLAPPETQMASSGAYRESLQKIFKAQLEKVNGQLDQMFGQVNKLIERLENSPDGQGTTSRIIIAQEEERKRISREIHDGPAQTLAALTMRIDFTLELLNKPQELKAELNELKDSIIRSLKDIRRFIFDLRPMALDDLGLLPTLDQFISGCKVRTKMGFNLTVEGKRVAISPDKELAIFRVVQEAVNNAICHSKARVLNVFLSFESERGFLTVAIRDDGIGFDTVKLRKIYSSLKKLGLVSMEERVRAIGGIFEIISAPGDGTVVSLKVPL